MTVEADESRMKRCYWQHSSDLSIPSRDIDFHFAATISATFIGSGQVCRQTPWDGNLPAHEDTDRAILIRNRIGQTRVRVF
jgi:hypothetical protein